MKNSKHNIAYELLIQQKNKEPDIGVRDPLFLILLAVASSLFVGHEKEYKDFRLLNFKLEKWYTT